MTGWRAEVCGNLLNDLLDGKIFTARRRPEIRLAAGVRRDVRRKKPGFCLESRASGHTVTTPEKLNTRFQEDRQAILFFPQAGLLAKRHWMFNFFPMGRRRKVSPQRRRDAEKKDNKASNRR